MKMNILTKAHLYQILLERGAFLVIAKTNLMKDTTINWQIIKKVLNSFLKT